MGTRLIAGAALLPGAVLGTPTGLNNIPTADTPAHQEGVFQPSSTFPAEGKADP